jgi:hypothetical protein
MRLVKFPLEYIATTRFIKYPDDISLFKNTEISGEFAIGEYYGQKLPSEIPTYTPTPKPIVTIQSIVAKNPDEQSLVYWDAANSFLAIPVGVRFVANATILNFPTNEIWNTPLLRNGILEGYALSQNIGSDLKMEGSFVIGGLWQITEAAVNEGLPENLHFTFPEVTAKVSS